MSIYEDRILPHLVHLTCSSGPVQKQRQKIVPLAEGDVLEIGFGSGLNLPYYDPGKVRRIWGLEPSEGMRQKARPLVEQTGLDVVLIDLPGERIPLEDHSVDTVLVTYSLCTISDVADALSGMRRVLKPAGRLLFCEHGLAPDEGVRRWQRRLNPGWRRIAGGCHLDRDIPGLIANSGFKLVLDERMYIPGIRAFCYNYWGVATTAR